MQIILLRIKKKALFGSAFIMIIFINGCSLSSYRQSEKDSPEPNIYNASCKARISTYQKRLSHLIANSDKIDDDKYIHDFDHIYYNINAIVTREKTLFNLHPLPNIRSEYKACANLAKASLEHLLKSPTLYNRMLSVNSNNRANFSLYKSQALKKFMLQGAHLPESQRTHYEILKKQASILRNRFLLAAQEDIRSIAFRDRSQSSGLPPEYINRIKRPERNIYEVTTNLSDYYIFMSYNKNEALRKSLYEKMYQRGYPGNEDILEDLFIVKEKIARIMGYDNYAAFIASNQILKTTKNIMDLLNKVERALRPRLKLELKDIKQKQVMLGINSKDVNEWNYRYIKTDQLEKNGINKNTLITYFPMQQVIDRTLSIMEDLYGLAFKEITIKTWHSSIRSFQAYHNNKLIGIIHLDLIARKGKHPHDGVLPLNQGLLNESIPETVLVFNFTENNKSSYLTIIQVEKLFHHFGHLLHTIFSGSQNFGLFSGLTMESDFIEVPALINEALLWDWSIFQKIAINDNKDSIPHALYNQLLRQRQLYKAIDLQKQIYLSYLSTVLYQKDTEFLDINKTEKNIFNLHSPFKGSPNIHFYANFENLVKYGPSYYAYLFSKAITEDFIIAFGRDKFKNPQIMQLYIEKILKQGGKKPAHQLIEDFLRRKFNATAYLKSLNLNADTHHH